MGVVFKLSVVAVRRIGAVASKTGRPTMWDLTKNFINATHIIT